MATNYPGTLDTDATVGGGTKPAAGTALDASGAGHPVHSALHQNVGDAIEQIETKLGTGVSTPAANKVLTSGGTNASAWDEVATDMIANNAITSAKIQDGAVGNDQLIDAPTFTTVTATDMTLGGQNLGEIVAFTPSYTNTSGFESNQGYYAYVKDLVYVSIETEFNGSFSVGDTRVDLPVSGSDTHQTSNAMLQVQLFDYSANTFYQGMATPVDTNTIQVRRVAVSGSNLIGGPTTADFPFTWADGDKILITGFYRVGS